MTLSASPANRIKRYEILADTWSGVKQKLQSLYSKNSQVAGFDIQVVPCGNLDYIENMLLQKDMNLNGLPVIGVTLSQAEPNANSYNQNVLRHAGQPLQINEGMEWWSVFKGFPVLATFQVMLLTDDLLTMIRMVDRWMSNETWGFELRYSNWAAKVKVTADKALAIPQRSPNSAGVEQYRLVTNLRAETYAGYVWEVPAIRAVKLQYEFPKGSLAQALAEGLVDGIFVAEQTEMGATDPQGLSIPYEPTS